MKRQFMIRFAFVVLMLMSICPKSLAADSPSDLGAFYTYTWSSYDNAYILALTEDFKTQVNKASGGLFTQGDYTLTTGMVLATPVSIDV